MTFEQTITDMGILANEVYDNKYLEFQLVDGVKQYKYPIKTANDTYTIIDSEDTWNGMQALLLKTSAGKFIIAFRGTEGNPNDIFYDITTGVLNYNPQIPEAMAFVQKALDNPDYNISSSNLTLTGHSLGGILTQSVGATMQIQGYTFNAWASSNLIDYSNYLLDPLGLIHRVASLLGWGAEATAFAERNILNLSYTDSGMFNGDILSNTLSGLLGFNYHLGATLPVFGADVDPFTGHRMPVMIGAINDYNTILSRFENKDFLVLTMAYILSDLTGRNQFYEKGESYFNAIGLHDAAANSLSFNFLNDLTQFELAVQAKSDRAVLFALTRLNGFAVEGNLSSYNSLDLAKYSEKYIQDRSLLLYHMLDPNNRDLGDLYIKDQAYGVSAGSDGWIWDNPKILFGYDGANQGYIEELIGGTKADHLFGMDGDDLLIGDAGNDYLEGGQGADRLFGGLDFDTYVSGDGDTIDDSDGTGEVYFEGNVLTGGMLTGIYGNTKTYEGDGGIYILKSDNTLIFSKEGNFVTINNLYSNPKIVA